ncbi:MAG: glycosyltransferase family 4 protein [Candidatus Kaelpia aquatica]|nr:glycosyltransferase family 4 protein [Candidatus Kaelpia aquatica]
MSLKDYELVFITRESPNLPGAKYRAYNFTKILKENGYRADVLSYAADLGAYSGILEQYLSIIDKISYNLKAYLRFKQYRCPLFVIQRFNYHSLAPLLFCLKNRIKFIYDIDDWEFRENIDYFKGIFPRSKAEFLFRKTARKAALCISGSHYLQDYITTITPKSYYLAPGIDIELFKPTTEKTALSKTLAWVGTMFREEDYINLKYLFKIMKDLPDLTLEVVGDGHYKSRITAESKRLELRNIIYRGWIEGSMIPKYLENISLGLFPLKVKSRFTEAKFPVKIIEFMSKGIPVIATSFGEVKSIIKDGENGLLAKDENDFKYKIEMILEDSELYSRISRSARESVVLNYSDRRQTQKLISILDREL